jgi:Zn finger protein HypA/HybF involved in hydrogenase expression
MQGMERFMIVVVFLATGSLIFVSASRSLERKIYPPTADPNNHKEAPAEKAGRNVEKRSTSSFVANPFCEACHADFDEEELAVNHMAFGIGCERCHGESFRHRSDEANVTPPEILYQKEKINPTCMMCHPRHDIQDVKDHRPLLEAARNAFGSPPSSESVKKYCTDCHGSKHRMKRRTIQWDKGTGALLKKND